MTYRMEGLRIDRFSDQDAKWGWQQRKAWIERAQDSGPGLYEMVASWYRSVGRDNDARNIAIARQEARTFDPHFGLSWWQQPRHWSWWQRRLHWLWGFLAGYGYQSWRAVVGLLLVWALGFAVFSFAEMNPVDDPAYPFYAWVYSADVVIPLVDLQQVSSYAPAAIGGLTWMWFSIAAGWVLSVALVAAVSGLFRND
jgi:hypothetical protein